MDRDGTFNPPDMPSLTPSTDTEPAHRRCAVRLDPVAQRYGSAVGRQVPGAPQDRPGRQAVTQGVQGLSQIGQGTGQFGTVTGGAQLVRRQRQ